MRERVEKLVLGLAGLLVLAFVGSFLWNLGAGIRSFGAPAVAQQEQPVERAVNVRDAVATAEVLNGSGVAGAARAVTLRLRDAGFDVVFYGNAPGGRADSSVVLDRTGAAGEAARAAARHLGIGAVETRADPALQVDLTVLLGADWAARAPAAGAEATAAEPGFWTRARRWLGAGR
jgi:hypothetical protein